MSHRLKVDRREFYTSLKPMARGMKPGQLGRIVLSFKDGRLLVDAGTAGTSIAAEGEWSRPVTLTGRRAFMRAVQHLPKAPSIYLTAMGIWLSISGTKVRCKRIGPDVARSHRILVVDDEPSICKILQNLLLAEGYKVDMALDALSGFQIMTRYRVDVVVTNVRMAPLSGLDMTKRIRKEFPDSAVIIHTAFAAPQVCRRAAELGASDIIPKPLKIEYFFRSIRNAATIGPEWRSDLVQAILAGCPQEFLDCVLRGREV